MKNTSKILLYAGALFIFLALFSGSLGKFIFDGLSNNATEKYIVKRSSIDSIDAKIDNSLYLVKQLELKIEKLKTFFSSEKPDESNYQRTENHIVRTSVYDTISSVFRVIFIMIFYFIGIFLLLAGIIFKLINRNTLLKKRIENLEHAVFRKDILIIENAD